MTSRELNPFSADYRNLFGNSYIRQFEVCDSQTERMGQATGIRVDESGYLQDLIVTLVAPVGKQVLIPLNQVHIDQQQQRVYVEGLSRAQIANLPVYDPNQTGQPPRPANAAYPTVTAPLDASAPLEASAPLDSRYISRPSSPAATSRSSSTDEQFIDYSNNPSGDTSIGRLNNQPNEERFYPDLQPENNEATVRLYEERLVVDRNKRRKVGEVIVRKEVETQLVEVPVRREKLIVEQVSPRYEKLAVVDLKTDQPINMAAIEHATAQSATTQPSVSGEFTSAEAASRFLDAIAHHPNAGHHTIQIKILMQDAAERETYQQWLERYLR